MTPRSQAEPLLGPAFEKIPEEVIEKGIGAKWIGLVVHLLFGTYVDHSRTHSVDRPHHRGAAIKGRGRNDRQQKQGRHYYGFELDFGYRILT